MQETRERRPRARKRPAGSAFHGAFDRHETVSTQGVTAQSAGDPRPGSPGDHEPCSRDTSSPRSPVPRRVAAGCPSLGASDRPCRSRPPSPIPMRRLPSRGRLAHRRRRIGCRSRTASRSRWRKCCTGRSRSSRSHRSNHPRRCSSWWHNRTMRSLRPVRGTRNSSGCERIRSSRPCRRPQAVRIARVSSSVSPFG